MAVLVAAAIIPLIGALGLATDTARGYLVKTRLAQALDSAALAGGKVMFSSNRDEDIQMFFDANFPPGFMNATIDGPHQSINDDETTLSLSASATIPTTFMRVLGFETLTVSAATEVHRSVDQLDLVLSIDMSGSMCSPCTKIEAAREAAVDLVEILFGENEESPTYEIDGEVYNLLNIGLVPWNSKVKAIIDGQAFTGSTAVTVPSFTNPITNQAQTTIWYANNSPVPLLSDPATLAGGWSGCVYARYTGDANSSSINTNDADMSRGPLTIGGKEWIAWEPAGVFESQPRSGTWGASDGEPSGSNWRGRPRSCYQQYWNNSNLASTDHPVAVSDRPSWWTWSRPIIGDSTPYNDDKDCAVCLGHGITPLTTSRAAIVAALEGLLTPQGTTNIPQGLAWAWEVLMPGEPFDEAVETVPFPRQRAIVLLTDGENHGGNGDAYKGRFGEGTGAGTTTNSAHGFLPATPPGGPNARNNLNNRLRQLAANVKAEGIDLYVIGFDLEGNTTALNLLRGLATEPNPPYFFDAPTEEELREAFAQIASNLSKLRLSK